MTNIPELTPTEFCERWPAGQREDVTLLDVREPAEWQAARGEGSPHLPTRNGRGPRGHREAATRREVPDPAEWQAARVEESLHIPMRTVPGRLDELDPAQTFVVMCHGGVRSLRVAEFLAASGYARVFNLTGGIDAWSLEIDSSVPRY